jgi:hypothetical protein
MLNPAQQILGWSPLKKFHFLRFLSKNYQPRSKFWGGVPAKKNQFSVIFIKKNTNPAANIWGGVPPQKNPFSVIFIKKLRGS